jgi:DNA-directed RNA polymerase alpha subunit
MNNRFHPGHSKRGAEAIASILNTRRRLWQAGGRFKERDLSEKTVEALCNADIDYPERLLFMPEAQIKKIAGLGPVRLAEVMAYVLRFRDGK